MCEPVTIIAAAGVVLNAYSQNQQAKASQDTADFNAAVASNNATLDDFRARDALQRGSEKIFARRLQQAQTIGTQRARLAARGLSLESGSALNILLDTDFIADLDVNTLSNNADKEAWALRQNAGAHRAQSSLLTAQAKAISPGLATTTTLLSGAVQVAGVHEKFKAPSQT